jgi:PTH1 family peptidyl-tRNA hydrolase
MGLGNPGPRYNNTRHNIGFAWVNEAVRQLNFDFKFSEKFESEWLTGKWNDLEIHFLKPQTYMNNSGQAYEKWKSKFQGPSQLLVVLDDLDLPVGKIRYRPDGSDAGHRGLRSIIEHSQTAEVPRLRIGIGKPAGAEAVDYVLEKFSPDDQEILSKVLASAGEQLKIWLTAKNAEEAMNKLNGATFKYVS